MLNKIHLPRFLYNAIRKNNLAILFTHTHVQDKTLELLGKRRISHNWNFRYV